MVCKCGETMRESKGFYGYNGVQFKNVPFLTCDHCYETVIEMETLFIIFAKEHTKVLNKVLDYDEFF